MLNWNAETVEIALHSFWTLLFNILHFEYLLIHSNILKAYFMILIAYLMF